MAFNYLGSDNIIAHFWRIFSSLLKFFFGVPSSQPQPVKPEPARVKRDNGLLPHVSADTSKPQNPLPSPPRIHSEIPQQFKAELLKQPWAADKDIVVNEETNTISVFEAREPSESKSSIQIPFYFNGLTIIPHSYPYIPPSEIRHLDLMSEPVKDGLTGRQIALLNETISGIRVLPQRHRKRNRRNLVVEGWDFK